jgi:hypothetical protein
MTNLNDLEKDILSNICKENENEIEVTDIENLLEIEKEYELSSRKS